MYEERGIVGWRWLAVARGWKFEGGSLRVEVRGWKFEVRS